MKKRILITFLSFGLCAAKSYAQESSSGITGGISMGSAKISDIGNNYKEVIEGNNIFGIKGGLFMKFNFAPVYIRPEGLIHYETGTVRVSSNAGELSTFAFADFKMNRLEIPVMVGIAFVDLLNVEMGPVYNYILKVTDNFHGYRADIAKNGYGYRIGVTSEIKRFSIGLSYQGTVNRADSMATLELPDEIIFSAALAFGKGKQIVPYGK